MASTDKKKITICFFGITRSLQKTYPSIERHVLAPARQLGDVRIYSHFFQQDQIDNPRTQEKGALDTEEYKLLNSDWLQLDPPDVCLETWDFEGLKTYGDVWGTEFTSLRNLVHQLHSLHAVTQAVLDEGADVCIFCRPDLEYHSSLAPLLKAALKKGRDTVYLPRWQAWDGGLNDRFAVCAGQGAIAAYGQRGLLAKQFCEETSKPLHSESLVEYSLSQNDIAVRTTPIRASRVRFDGTMVDEDFTHPIRIKLWPVIRTIRRGGGVIARTFGVKEQMKKLLRLGKDA